MEVGFIAGLCVGEAWVGDPEKRIELVRAVRLRRQSYLLRK
jgi:hypothetical protein